MDNCSEITAIIKKNNVTQLTKCFEVGKTYSTRSICDSDCIFSFEILGRTAKTITFKSMGAIKTKGIKIHEAVETCLPQGRHSMAPMIRADREAK
jgi:hypothetical protein